MAEMGPVRKIDDLGRVVIPKEFRKTFNWPIGMEVEISAADGKVIVAKHSTACVFCGKPTRVQMVNSIFALPALQSIKHSSMKSLICQWSEVNVVSFTHHQVECVSMEHADPKEDD